MKIPQEIVDDFKQRKNINTPLLSIRGLADIHGNIGETYILGSNESLLFYSGQLGEEYKFLEFSFANIQHLNIEEERPFAYLTFEIHNQPFRLKFALFDLKILCTIRESWEKTHEHSKEKQSTTSGTTDESSTTTVGSDDKTFTSKLTPILGFCAAMQALVHIDSHVSEEEKKKLPLIINDPQQLAEGFEYWQKIGTDQLISELCALLSSQQKLCLLANLLEVAMIDGILHESEKVFIESLRKSLGVDVKDFNTLFDVLITKNNLTIY